MAATSVGEVSATWPTIYNLHGLAMSHIVALFFSNLSYKTINIEETIGTLET